MTRSGNLDKWQKTVDLVAELYGAAAASIVELQGSTFEVLCTSGGERNRLDERHGTFPLSLNSFCRATMETGALFYVNKGDTHPEWATAPPVQKLGVISYLGVPIRRPDQSFFGTICVKHDEGTDYSDVFVRTLEQFRDLIEADLLLEERARQMEAMALTDVATGCANRRGLRDYVSRQDPSNTDGWGILYFDLDNLKATNDRFGHDCGDRAIELLGRTLTEHAREHDIAARVGGDEFVLMARLPDAEVLDAIRARIVAAFDRGREAQVELALIGVSVGTLYIDPDQRPLDLDTLISFADARMYDSKRARKAGRSDAS